MVTDEAELQRIEGHLLACAPCAERVRQTRKYILAMKAALAAGALGTETMKRTAPTEAIGCTIDGG